MMNMFTIPIIAKSAGVSIRESIMVEKSVMPEEPMIETPFHISAVRKRISVGLTVLVHFGVVALVVAGGDVVHPVLVV